MNLKHEKGHFLDAEALVSYEIYVHQTGQHERLVFKSEQRYFTLELMITVSCSDNSELQPHGEHYMHPFVIACCCIFDGDVWVCRLMHLSLYGGVHQRGGATSTSWKSQGFSCHAVANWARHHP